MHPIKRTRDTITAVKLTILNFQKLLFALIAALDKNTAATSALLETSQKTLAACTEIQSATAYMERADRHTRRSSGHEVPNV